MTEREKRIANNVAELMCAARTIDPNMTWKTLLRMTLSEFISFCSNSDKGRLVLQHEEVDPLVPDDEDDDEPSFSEFSDLELAKIADDHTEDRKDEAVMVLGSRAARCGLSISEVDDAVSWVEVVKIMHRKGK